MKHRVLLTLACTFIIGICSAQNFSGLLNKKLNKIEDVGSLIESGLGSLFGGKIEGKVDSVIVTHDAEKMLKVKIWFTGYINGYVTASTLNASRQKQNEITPAKFSQATKASPVELSLPMLASVPKGTKLESAYLRIDISKKENGSGNVNVFALNKNWKSELDAQNVVINVSLQPVGKAASLTNQVKDVVPDKQIKFDPKIMYYKDDLHKVKPIMRSGGGGNYVIPYDYSIMELPDDISGTWVNTDANTNGITKLIVTNNNTIQGFGRCSPQDCDWGKTGLASLGGNNFKAVFSWSFKTTTLTINYAGGQLTVTGVDNYKDGRASRSYSASFKKNVQLVYTASRIYTLNQVAVMNPTTSPSEGTVPKGPDKNFQISLIDAFSADVDFRRPQDISSINLNGFLDINKNSGIVYILPADYHLKWETKTEPEKGYDFRILYGSQPGAGATESTDAPVRMSATLTAGISTREINFVKTLLKASLPGFKNVKYLPLRENPQFTFQNTLGAQYNIPQNKITVETSTDLNNDIRVAWQTDADTKEFIQTALTAREGIAASVILKPDNEDILDQQIPAIINLADIRTLGKINLEPNAWRSRNWRNTTPYPLKLNYLHVLKKENNGTMPIIYSWSMNEAIIPSQAQVAFNSSIVPAWLDNAESVVMWMDYSIMDCGDCDRKVMDAVTGGVSGSKAQQIKFTIPPAVFDTLGASYFLITVRSLQVDPKGELVKELAAVKVTNDMTKEFVAGPLFIPSGGAMDFEYKITVATTDGEFYPANDWIRGTDKEVLLGKTKMKEIFRGIVPGID